METVRFGIIGLGNMGSFHAAHFDKIENAKLAAVCDGDAARLETMAKKFGVPGFGTYRELIDSGLVDAVIVATPHYQHPEITIAAFEKNLHVLCEKPAAVTVKQARRMNDAAAKHPKLKFGMMFQMRTSPLYKKVRDIVQSGDLGEISRITWICTLWFRSWAYYASGGWRATWAGEGGGVLINQTPHNLDQLHWLTGMMPKRVTAVAAIGKTHPIEVEDEVSAIFEYENGAIGHFTATTGEAPGTDRLEIAGDRGRLVAENGTLKMKMTRKSVREIRETTPQAFPTIEVWDVDVPLDKNAQEGHTVITQNFVNAILKDEQLLSPGTDGVKGLEIGNAILMAGLTRTPVELPMDGDAYEAFIADLTRKYGGRKTLQSQKVVADVASSFR